jgi:TonB family protein
MKKTIISFLLLSGMTFFVSAQQDKNQQKAVKAGFGLTVVQEQAEFPGGSDSLQAFLNRNLTYPLKAKTDRISGKVYVSFVVSMEGKIVDSKVISGITPELDQEALRVIALMPDWKPGTASGNPVKVQYILPIDFVLPKFGKQ